MRGGRGGAVIAAAAAAAGGGVGVGDEVVSLPDDVAWPTAPASKGSPPN